ncbi:MAG: gfo/Idh/MocA family oxidoreductase [Oscillatoriales cyanobacterium]|nr:MAG: gfo/Idh/MocA family oxidoreductase [Oscillatoriales cyanobacterium]
MGDRTVGMAVIGAGRWGKHLIRQFANHPRSRLVAVAEANPELLAETVDRWSGPADRPEIRFTSHAAEAIALPTVEAVAIATPAITHFELVRLALCAGKHVLVEKPLTLDPIEGDRLGELARSHQLQLMVDHTYLFHPAVEAGAAIVRAGKLADLRYGYGARTHLGPVRQDVDALWDLAIHDIAIFNHWLQSSPIAVSAQGQTWLQPGHAAGSDRPNPAAGLADLVWLTLHYPPSPQWPQPFTATIHLCWNNPDRSRRLGLVGSAGTLVFDEMNSGSPLTLFRGQLEQTDRQWVPINQTTEAIALEPGEPLGRVCDRFLAGILDRVPLDRSDARVGTGLVRVLAAASRSLASGGAIMAIDLA